MPRLTNTGKRLERAVPLGARPLVIHVHWEPNWIDYRHSLANIDRRHDRGDNPPTCGFCGCELDLDPVPHSPRCAA